MGYYSPRRVKLIIDPCSNMTESQMHCPEERSQSPNATPMRCHLNDILKQAKLLRQKTDQWLPRLEVTNGHEGIWGTVT